MKRSFMLLIAIVALAVPQVASAQGGFSSLFDTPSTPQAPEQQNNSRVAELLTQAGYVVKEQYDDGSAFVEIERGGLTFPVAAGMTGNQARMWVDVVLTKVPENGSQHIDKILHLLELSGSRGSAFFAYREQHRMIHLIDAIAADKINTQNVKSMVDGVIDMALSTQPDWNTSLWTQARHIGQWSSPLSQGNMEIALQSDGSFQLTNRNGKSITQIAGTYQLNGDTLIMLDGQGTKLTAEIRFTDGNHFDLTLNGANLSFERA